MLNCKFYGGRKQRRRISFSLSKVECAPQEQTPGKFAYICNFQQIGINATVFEKREFILKLTFSLPLLSSMLKLPDLTQIAAHISEAYQTEWRGLCDFPSGISGFFM